MTDIQATLKERGSNYGKFEDQARISQHLKTQAHSTHGWGKLACDQKEAIDMILHKIARILNGNPDLHDSWHDISGYSTLVANRLEKPSS